MFMSILHNFMTLKWNISRIIWLIEVSDGSFLHFSCSFSWAKHFSDWSFPLRLGVLVCLAEYEKLPYPYFNSRYCKTLSSHLKMLLAMTDENLTLTWAAKLILGERVSRLKNWMKSPTPNNVESLWNVAHDFCW